MSVTDSGLVLTCVDMNTKDVFHVDVTDGDTMADIRMMIAASRGIMGG